jgi:hypothetical protein
MNILLIGGTRFLGKALALRLARRHQVTVLSRNSMSLPGVKRWVGDRMKSLPQVKAGQYDLIIDFIAYDEQGVPELLTKTAHYLTISSLWLCRGFGIQTDEPVLESLSFLDLEAPEITHNYLLGKQRLENLLYKKRSALTGIIRLPILLGREDHTGRLCFYGDKVSQEKTCYVDTHNTDHACILWSEDAASVIFCAIDQHLPQLTGIWEVVPEDGGCSITEWLGLIGQVLEKAPVVVPVNSHTDEGRTLLKDDPLWREITLQRSRHNLFDLTGISSTPPAQWLSYSLLDKA